MRMLILGIEIELRRVAVDLKKKLRGLMKLM